jgi:GNAT superfamily N-acetyltransferase
MMPTPLDTIRVRRLTVDDIDPAARLLTSAFGGTQDRKADLHRFFQIQVDGGIVATRDGELLGMVGSLEFEPFVCIGMMAVDPRYQRHGIGRLLMERLLDSIDRRGWRMSILEASRSGARLYPKMGFVDEGETHQFRLADHVPSGGPPPSRVYALQSQDLPALEDFDAPVFGARRGRVLAAYLAAFPDRAFFTRDQEGEIAGYMIAQPQRLGPWVARAPQALDDLLQAALRLTYTGSPRVLVPDCSHGGIVRLQHCGFEFVETHRRMRRGGGGSLGRRGSIVGLASYFIG